MRPEAAPEAAGAAYRNQNNWLNPSPGDWVMWGEETEAKRDAERQDGDRDAQRQRYLEIEADRDLEQQSLSVRERETLTPSGA